MTPFASVALFRRNGNIVFRPARKEATHDKTQARKAASRFWRGHIQEPDKLVKIALVRCTDSAAYVCERDLSAGHGRSWIEYRVDHAEALKQPHLAACLAELGIDADTAPPPVPDVLVINGHTYRRDI